MDTHTANTCTEPPDSVLHGAFLVALYDDGATDVLTIHARLETILASGHYTCPPLAYVNRLADHLYAYALIRLLTGGDFDFELTGDGRSMVADHEAKWMRGHHGEARSPFGIAQALSWSGRV